MPGGPEGVSRTEQVENVQREDDEHAERQGAAQNVRDEPGAPPTEDGVGRYPDDGGTGDERRRDIVSGQRRS